jgi:acyl dehydratase
MALKALTTPRWTSSHVVRWCAAQHNWHKVHYDLPFARDVEGLPERVINGAFKQQLLVHFLCEAFDGRAWPWRLDFRFEEIDFVGQRLEVRGTVEKREREDGLEYVHVDAGIWNLDHDVRSTTARCVVIVDPSGEPVLAAPSPDALPQALRLSQEISEATRGVPEALGARLGSPVEVVRSVVPVDLSRLRLFAEAVGCIRPIHHDPAAAADGPYQQVTAPPLFPPHGIENAPGTRDLSEDAEADGTEGSAEIGRHFRLRFDLDMTRTMNGGNSVEIHSLARVGEHICGTSRLAAAKHRVGKRAGPMLILQGLNSYTADGGRPLLTERQTAVCL